ncbi:hypothetical protein CBW65_19940 [Tumebacillus avium]|uniref:Tox-URI2 domain-containing protein n=1 Tax=Tumebacillus avium TaxID=1903704 RepID=A0A1Y0IU30_9BACL|nr:hypothetical protein CBW65_19940 [Tumebacillus avium]
MEIRKIEVAKKQTKVYNFSVQDFHSYFVSDLKVWVHNEKCDAVKSLIHGNSKASTKEQHGYEIFEKETGDVVKTGISGQKLNKNGSSPRANSQVNKWNKQAGNEKYQADVVAPQIPNRQDALEWERNNAQELWENGNSMNRHQRPKPWEE